MVFAGDRLEAELVMRILQEEGFHPWEWADLPAPAYVGPIGMARIVVPLDEGEAAKAFIASFADAREAEEEERDDGEAT